ncbi:MAG: transcription elongation factor GreA [Ruminococcaceae bacterium]|nr:transcription elongation factor GreA [Oscillospiraceae bacterium]
MFRLTQKEYDALLAELKDLKQRRIENIEAIKVAKSHGDLSENSEYDAAKDEEGKIESAIAVIEAQIKDSVIIDESALSTSTVQTGLFIKIFDKGMNTEDTIQIVAAPLADAFSGKFSDISPLGQCLLGKKVGDVVSLKTPDGTVNEITVLEIFKAKN